MEFLQLDIKKIIRNPKEKWSKAVGREPTEKGAEMISK